MLSNAGVILFFAVWLVMVLDSSIRTLVQNELGIPPLATLIVGFICLLAVTYGNRRKTT
jgi:hypothetical protein